MTKRGIHSRSVALIYMHVGIVSHEVIAVPCILKE